MADDTTTDDITSRVTARVDDLRDATAQAISSDEAPAARELDRVRRRLDQVEDSLTGALAGLGDQQREIADELHANAKRTTFPRKLFWLLLGGAAGAALAYLQDPDRGKARRTQLSDQVTSQARAVADQASTQATQAANKAKGSAIEATKAILPDDVPEDSEILVQRVKSQVLGHRDGTDNITVTATPGGEVTLTGTVDDLDTVDELVDEIGAVNGVTHVESHLLAAA
ncbi:MAG TPA: BON domain-containing protein [Nitriliruptoraceae bacterium]|nr:BON domain-containing protein [Nitriliruptoraceae bacterium]